jgi:DNA-binding XRE family transcriptional regulator
MTHALSPVVTGALVVIGQEIRTARQEHGWTIEELADRAGVSEKTVRTIEAGSPTPAIGTVFELAWLVGLNLLGRDEVELPTLIARGEDRLALAPKRVRTAVRKPRERF